ncbi:hypothetical protein N658DRAFT_292768 [Parathielavia hyrcaniae]|uniref:Uncharacterized protein n=1 Tax=Parathielavia hyrcaniae TaxID=113614 RepID=A0AAN6PTE0_9PEZI|nr:hypothetical protein N658DRAFT_292768 [Parathielavia hyrcaniae]
MADWFTAPRPLSLPCSCATPVLRTTPAARQSALGSHLASASLTQPAIANHDVVTKRLEPRKRKFRLKTGVHQPRFTLQELLEGCGWDGSRLWWWRGRQTRVSSHSRPMPCGVALRPAQDKQNLSLVGFAE